MPELPEVETIRKQLMSKLPCRITGCKKSQVVKSILHDEEFDPVGLNLREIVRKGKLLCFRFEDKQRYLLSHLGMTGTWLQTQRPPEEKHNHLQFECERENGEKFYLSYVDPRRFGHMYFAKEELYQKKWNELGMDLTDSAFTLDHLTEILKKYPQRALKVTLLDQKLFAGSGNYIANEICARAGIRPESIVGKIPLLKYKDIHSAIAEVLDQSLDHGGVTFSGGYRDSFGDKGKGVSNLVVFHQKTCRLCNVTEVKKITLAQRGTFYCPKCQQLY